MSSVRAREHSQLLLAADGSMWVVRTRSAILLSYSLARPWVVSMTTNASCHIVFDGFVVVILDGMLFVQRLFFVLCTSATAPGSRLFTPRHSVGVINGF